MRGSSRLGKTERTRGTATSQPASSSLGSQVAQPPAPPLPAAQGPPGTRPGQDADSPPLPPPPTGQGQPRGPCDTPRPEGTRPPGTPLSREPLSGEQAPWTRTWPQGRLRHAGDKARASGAWISVRGRGRGSRAGMFCPEPLQAASWPSLKRVSPKGKRQPVRVAVQTTPPPGRGAPGPPSHPPPPGRCLPWLAHFIRSRWAVISDARDQTLTRRRGAAPQARSHPEPRPYLALRQRAQALGHSRLQAGGLPPLLHAPSGWHTAVAC